MQKNHKLSEIEQLITKPFDYRTWWNGKMQTPSETWEGDVFIRLNGETALCADTGEWENGYHVYFNKVKGIILMQFTGLKDKKKKKIYEGDIIKTRWKRSRDKETRIVIVPNLKNFHWFSELEDMWVEVIGNVFETPELISKSY